MNSAHDLGGMHGFGAVELEENEPVFHEGWERTAFGLTALAGARGLTGTGDAMRHAIERIGNVRYFESSYYERWMHALSTLLVENGVITSAELEARLDEVRRDPERFAGSRAGGESDELAAATERAAAHGAAVLPRIDRKPRFAVGDEVRATRRSPVGHTRLPRYVRGCRGTVVRYNGVHVFPDTNAHGLGECPDHLYTVRFPATELWGDSADGRGCVNVDLWEGYLEEGAR